MRLAFRGALERLREQRGEFVDLERLRKHLPPFLERKLTGL